MDLESFRKKAGSQNQYEARYTSAKTKKEIMEEVLEKSDLFKKSDFGNYNCGQIDLQYTGFKKLLKLVERYKDQVTADKSFPYHEP
ncbi:MAG: hypothetical protein EF811_02235 [Methanonatronarchaeia archaeon]|nr:MAG: hypothetical protein EF811_02235 [Methanonatronarchaeia archaeon]